MTKASSGLSSFSILLTSLMGPVLILMGFLARRMAVMRAVLILGFWAKLLGKEARQVGQLVLPCWPHFWKQTRQKLCWQGAVTGLR